MIHFNLHEGLMVLFNLLILFIILKYILFDKVTNFMEARSNEIKNSIDSSIKAKEDAEEMKTSYHLKLNAAIDEADKIVNDAKSKAHKEYDSIVLVAKKDAEKIISNAKAEIEKEKSKMINELKNQVTLLAISAASKVIEANMDTASNRQIVDKFIKEEGAI